MVEVREEMGLT